MFRSRMLTPGFRIFGSLALFLLFGAYFFTVSSELQVPGTTVRQQLDAKGLMAVIMGPLTVGWKGGVGNHLGYAILLGAAGIAAFIAFVLIAFRDADPEAAAEVVHTETVPLTRAPHGANYSPIALAFALAFIAIGWVDNRAMFYGGLILLIVTAGAWTIRAWAERATGDDEINAQIYQRIIDPLRVPLISVVVIGFVVYGLSRVILAAPSENASAVLFGAFAVVFFVGILAVYFLRSMAKPLAIVLLAVGGLAVLIGGVVSLVHGERPVETKEAPATEGGMAPLGPVIVVHPGTDA
jgi:hypothetical protein